MDLQDSSLAHLRPRFKRISWRRAPLLLLMGIGGAIAIISLYLLLIAPPSFPTGQVIDIPADAHVGEIASLLEGHGAIHSTFVFRAYTRLTRQDRDLTSGLFVFKEPLGLVALVHRLASGEYGIDPLRVTFTEGMTAADMARVLKTAALSFDSVTFLELAAMHEGYLFPDTYFLMPNSTPQEVVLRLRERFDERAQTIAPQIADSGHTLDQLVIMASLLEREANTTEDMRIVSGILWKRLAEGMLLQVDAPFGYLHGENGYTPTAADLELDSPYNTYRYEGLPPTPIANPGLVALSAAAQPLATDYFYYLTGRDGLMHYARTFEEHKANRARYLD